MKKDDFSNKTFLGIVEDNDDPKKSGRCRIRVFDVFDDIPTNDIPWASPFKDLNGNGINIPDIGKILVVVFDSGNIYTPEYIYAQHYNVNLTKKLNDLTSDDYKSFKALIFDHKTQIYVDDSEGLKIDYKFNMINIKDKSINVDLKDNHSSLNLGCEVASQRAILGDSFLNWFDKFVMNLLGSEAGPYLGNLGAPVVPNPAFIDILTQYQALKEPKFLSHHVNIVDNESVQKLDRVANGQMGDKIKTTDRPLAQEIKQIPPQKIDYKPKDGQSTDVPQNADLTPPTDDRGNVVPSSANDDISTATPTQNDDITKILNAMKSKNYVVLTKQFEMNIVGIRRQYAGSNYSDSFADSLYVIYKDENNNWQKGGPYKISTIPGATITDPVTKEVQNLKKYKKNPNSTKTNPLPLIPRKPNLGTMMEAQYLNIYKLGNHAGARAMISIGKQKAYRDTDVDSNVITYSVQDEGNFGMLIHKGYPGGSKVANWSEGCQVFRDENSLNSFFDLMDRHINSGNPSTFNYTLMRASDVGL